MPCKTVGQAVTKRRRGNEHGAARPGDVLRVGVRAGQQAARLRRTWPPGRVRLRPAPRDPAVHATITSAGAAPALHLQGGGSVTNLRLKGADGANVGPRLQLGTGMTPGTRTYSVTNVVAIGGINGTVGRHALVVTDAGQPGTQIDATVTGGHFSSAGTSNQLEVVTLDGANVSGTLVSTSIVAPGRV